MKEPHHIGHMTFAPDVGHPVPPQDMDLMVFTNRGTCEYAAQNARVHLVPGDVLFVPRTLRGVAWRVTGNAQWEAFWFFARLDAERVKLLATSATPDTMSRWHTTGLTHARMEAAFRRLSQLQGIPHQSAGRLRTALVDVILAEVGLDRDSLPETPDPVVAKARAYLDSRIPTPTSVGDLVAACGIGRTSLIVRFTKAMGISPMKYLEERRLVTAAERLRSGLDSIAEIARSVGYADSRYFATRFRLRYRLSPNEWRHTPGRTRLTHSSCRQAL